MYVIGLVVTVIVILAILSPTAEQWQVLAPLLAGILIVATFGQVLYRRSRLLPLDDIGFWHVAFVALYIVLPLGVFLALGLEYTPLNDSRLFTAQPTAALVGRIGWYHVAYLGSVALAYVWTTRHVGPSSNGRPPVPFEWALTAATIWLFCELFFVGLGFIYQLSAASYFDSYVVVQRLPLFARQLYRLAEGIRVVVSLVLLIWVFADYPRRKAFLWAGLVLVAVETVVGGGSRTALMTLMAGSVILYHRFVRPLSLRAAVVGAAIVIVAFTALGVRRQLRYVERGEVLPIGIGAGEFDAMFANAVDLEQRRENHELSLDLAPLYLSELLGPIPSQILPFQKRDLSIWYLDTFYPGSREQGQGFAFGVVAQSIVGLGWPELVFRGALIGWLFGVLRRWERRAGNRPWVLGAYLWFTVLSYQAFRNSSLVLLSMFVQQAVPAIILLWIGSSLIAATRKTSGVPVGLQERGVG